MYPDIGLGAYSISFSTQIYTDTHHKLSAAYSDRRTIWKMAFSSVLNHLTFLHLPSTCSVSSISVKLSISWNLICLPRRLFNIGATTPPHSTQPMQYTHSQHGLFVNIGNAYCFPNNLSWMMSPDVNLFNNLMNSSSQLKWYWRKAR